MCHKDYLTCELCETGLTMQFDGSCEVSCPFRQYSAPYASVDNITGTKCKNCTKHCKKCIGDTTCTTCTDSAYLHFGQCVFKCPDGYYRIPKLSAEGRECRPSIHAAIAFLFIAALFFFVLAMICLHLKRVCANLRSLKRRICPNKVKNTDCVEDMVDDEPEDEDLIEDLEQQLNAKRFVGLKSEQFREKKINAKSLPSTTKYVQN